MSWVNTIIGFLGSGTTGYWVSGFSGLLSIIAIAFMVKYPDVFPTFWKNTISSYIQYLPNALFVYGFIADIINAEYHHSIQSITALALIMIVKAVDKYNIEQKIGSIASSGISSIGSKLGLFAGATAAAGVVASGTLTAPTAMAVIATAIIATAIASVGIEPNDECALPGILGWFDNKIAPANMMTAMTILWYSLFEGWDNGMGDTTTNLGLTTMVTFLAQCFSYYLSNCKGEYKYPMLSPAIALTLSIGAAAASFYTNKALAPTIYTYQNKNGLMKTNTPGVYTCAPGQVPDANGMCKVSSTPPKQTPIVVGEPSRQTEPVDDNDQFVCEAYKDGELITSTIVD